MRLWSGIRGQSFAGAVTEHSAKVAELGKRKLDFCETTTSSQCAEGHRTTISLEQRSPKIAKIIMKRLPLR